MKHIYVVQGMPRRARALDVNEAVSGYTAGCLISLIDGLRQKSFGHDTLLRAARMIRKFKARYAVPNDWRVVVDSGGYSFIKGNIRLRDAAKAIGCDN